MECGTRLAMTERNTDGTAWKPPSTVDEYLAQLPSDVRDSLEQLRGLIKFTFPEAKERIGYRIPVFLLRRDLVGFAAYRDYCSLYAMSPGLVNAMQEELRDYKVSGATIRFTAKEPLPVPLVKKILLGKAERAG
jgi:uncharacterized protein YdhG (YjbR/CyaY superfamily)